MCQPSGLILGYPSSHNFVIRCSPIICAVSAFDTATRMTILASKERSFKAGLAQCIANRFYDRPDDEDGSFNSLRKNTIFRLVLFGLGALPQIIKIYSCRGIPWTQVWCTAYLAAFLVDESLVATALVFSISTTPHVSRDPSTQYPPPSSRNYLRLSCLASLILGFVYLSYDVRKGKLHTLCSSQPKALQSHETYLLVMAASLMNPMPDLHLENSQYTPKDVVEITLQITSLVASICFLVGVNSHVVCYASSETLKSIWDGVVFSTQMIATAPGL